MILPMIVETITAVLRASRASELAIAERAYIASLVVLLTNVSFTAVWAVHG